MILKEKNTIIQTNLKGSKKEFTPTQEGIRILIQHTSEKLYSNPIRAIVREYFQNSLDSHTMAGVPDSRIVITAPTMERQVYSVRDYGVSMDAWFTIAI